MKGYQIVLGLVAFVLGSANAATTTAQLYGNDEKYLSIAAVEISEIPEEATELEIATSEDGTYGIMAGTGPKPRPSPSPSPRSRRGNGGGVAPGQGGNPPPVDPGDIDLPPFPPPGNGGIGGGGGYWPPIGGGIGGGIGDAGIIIDQIINIGRQIWEIIDANRPQVNYKRDTASAVPQGIEDWTQLQGWSAPVSKAFRATYKNFLGQSVVDFPFRVIYTYGGNVNGKGKFLTNVTIAPRDLKVGWNYKFDASVEVASVSNAGTHTDPIGAIEIMIHWAANSSFKHMEGSESFYIRGDGAFRRIVDTP